MGKMGMIDAGAARIELRGITKVFQTDEVETSFGLQARRDACAVGRAHIYRARSHKKRGRSGSEPAGPTPV